MPAIEKRSGKWRAKVRKSGSSLSKTFTKKSDAISWAVEAERSINLRLPLAFHNQCTSLADLLERYARNISPLKKGGAKEACKIAVILKHQVAEIAITDLTPTDIARYRDDRLTRVTTGTVRRELSIISHALNVAMREWSYNLTSNPVSKIRKPTAAKARTRRLEKGEEERLLSSCRRSTNHWFFPLVCFAIETGMRRGEMLSLEWKDVHVDQGWVHLEETKNGSPRDVPLSTTAKGILRDLPRDISGFVFPIHFEALKGLWRRATRRVGIDDLHFHDLRHEATSRFFEKGLNVMEVATITGHKDLRMLQRYTHLKAEDLAIKLG